MHPPNYSSKRKLVVRSKSLTDPKFGKKPEDRGIEEYIKYGVINLDKPSGPTSHEVVAWVKNILNLKKAGHGGTLDPKVTGILPITLEDVTKVVKSMLNAGKEYVCLMRLHEGINEEKIYETCREFEGEIIQRPPLKSAVKRRFRTRRIYYLKILEIEDRNVLFRVGCEAGTYIRKLCHDIGEASGCGAHMLELRRTKMGPFDESTLVNLHDVLDAYRFLQEEGTEEFIREVIFPVERAVEHLPRIEIRDSAVDSLCHGADLAIPGISKLDWDMEKGELVAIFSLKGELVALGNSKMTSKDILTKETGIAVVSERVIMRPDTYPKMWKSR